MNARKGLEETGGNEKDLMEQLKRQLLDIKPETFKLAEKLKGSGPKWNGCCRAKELCVYANFVSLSHREDQQWGQGKEDTAGPGYRRGAAEFWFPRAGTIIAGHKSPLLNLPIPPVFVRILQRNR